MVQSWKLEDKLQDDKRGILCLLSNQEDKKQDDEQMTSSASYIRKEDNTPQTWIN